MNCIFSPNKWSLLKCAAIKATCTAMWLSSVVPAMEYESIEDYVAMVKTQAPAPSATTTLFDHTIPAPGGLIVVLGDAYPQVAQALDDGYWLVRGYTDQTGKAQAWYSLTEATLPLTTVQVLPNTQSIPLLDATVNVVVYDPASGFSEAEALRILAPKGTLLTESGTNLTATQKAEDERYDDWTHYSANEFTTNANNDTAVAPSM